MNQGIEREYDVAVVGASLAGCATAILLARTGARVALVERSPDPASFKRICSHYIQPSAVPTLERLDLLDPILAAGGIRSPLRLWTPFGLIDPPAERVPDGVNLRREVLDPLVRDAAAATPGVELLLLGHNAERLLRRGGAFAGVAVRDGEGAERELTARLTVGADGRASRVAELANVRVRTRPHGRFVYGAYYEGALPPGDQRSCAWFMDPQCAVCFPTDDGLTMCAAMMTLDRLPEFKPDPEAAVLAYFADLPEAPSLAPERRVGDILGKVEMPNRIRRQTSPGLALVGDAALATDPLFGIGCGWALQSAEWLADSVAPALRDEESLARGLRRYRRRHNLRLRGHALPIHDYSTGRPMYRYEKALYRAATTDSKLAGTFAAYATREIGLTRLLAEALPRVAPADVRHTLRRRSRR